MESCYFRQKKKLPVEEEDIKVLLISIQQCGAKFADLRTRRPGETLRKR